MGHLVLEVALCLFTLVRVGKYILVCKSRRFSSIISFRHGICFTAFKHLFELHEGALMLKPEKNFGKKS